MKFKFIFIFLLFFARLNSFSQSRKLVDTTIIVFSNNIKSIRSANHYCQRDFFKLRKIHTYINGVPRITERGSWDTTYYFIFKNKKGFTRIEGKNVKDEGFDKEIKVYNKKGIIKKIYNYDYCVAADDWGCEDNNFKPIEKYRKGILRVKIKYDFAFTNDTLYHLKTKNKFNSKGVLVKIVKYKSTKHYHYKKYETINMKEK